MIAQRVEKHIIKKNSPHYSMLLDFCHRSKNLYNHANYIIREELTKNGKWIRYNDLDKILKADKEYPDYADMPTAASAQQIPSHAVTIQVAPPKLRPNRNNFSGCSVLRTKSKTAFSSAI